MMQFQIAGVHELAAADQRPCFAHTTLSVVRGMGKPVLKPVNRRQVLKTASLFGAAAGLKCLAPSYAWANSDRGELRPPANGGPLDLSIRKHEISIAGGIGKVVSVNGTVPAPLLRLREGETVTIRARNEMDESTSIHWHGLLVPWQMDGVPGVSFRGIPAKQSFTYQFTLRQSGTYWYHSHSAFQEQIGLYGPLIIEPLEPEPYQYDREYVVILSDWTFEDPMRVLDKTKKLPSYYNFQQRTIGDFFRDIRRRGVGATLSDRLMWARMRMNPTDILDVTGYTYTYLINGLSPELNWTGLFTKGERVRLRFINSGAMTIFDVRIPGLKLTVVQADGQDVVPVEVDEFRMGAAETFDVIVQPQEDRPYTIFAEAMDRSGFAAGTLSPRPGLRAEIPPRRKRPLRTMKDMGMAHTSESGGHADQTATANSGNPNAPATMHTGHEQMMQARPAEPGHQGHQASGAGPAAAPSKTAQPGTSAAHSGHQPGMAMGGGPASGKGMRMRPGAATAMIEPGKPAMVMHGPDTHGPGNAMIAEMPQNRLGEPGTGLEDAPWRVLVYTDLRRVHPDPHFGPPQEEIELHLTGNMERNMWSINGEKFSEASEPIPIRFGITTRFTLVNDTMMDHPMHIHGMWMKMENGGGPHRPFKHTILVKAGERMSYDVTPDEPGNFAFHCHLLFHMEFGMFRVVGVRGGKAQS